jgi:RHS repeat-associated protein
MKTQTRIGILVVVLTIFLNLPAFSAKPKNGNPSAPLPGQTVTLLPDGSSFLAGGQDANGHPLGTLALRETQGTEQELPLSLQFPRMGHTATVLPDGTVLILGGIGADGRIVPQAEIFDPESQSLQVLSSGAPAPRAFHSATLLTDGRMLVAGGVGLDGEPLRAELWDPRRKTSSTTAGQVNAARRNHSATLLANGRVLLSGGKDGDGNPLSSGDLYEPQSQTFSAITNPLPLAASGSGIAEATATSPEDGATDVPLSALISMRFSRPLQAQTINNETVLLESPVGIVDAKVVGAEGGMLAFITPKAALLPGTNYSVKFSGAVDINNATAAFLQFTFTTAGEAPSSDTWSPDLGWMSNRSTSKFQSLPPLEAGPGVTALAGQVLKLDGTPLERVTLMIGDRKAVSDGTGRFLLANVPSGHSSVMILGNTANTSTRAYGIYEVGVEIKSGITNVLRYIIWMTPLDTAHSVKIPSPTTSETVITTPMLPGLELHLPANAVITDYYGKPVTEISITPIPLDRPPFPLPNVQVPLYFTIQPGAAYIKVMRSIGSQGARLFYPNAYGYPPGTAYNFWNYDPDKRGWYVYGQGRVSADRSQIIPDPGVLIYEFTGAMVAVPGVAPGVGPSAGGGSSGGDPIDLGTGLFVYRKTDLTLRDVIPIDLTRVYRPGDSTSHAFGIGASMAYDMFNVGDNSNSPEGYTFQDLILADGGRIHFQRTSPCTGTNGYCDFTNAVYEQKSSPTGWFGATIKYQSCSPNGIWTLTTKDGSVLCFRDSGASNNARVAAVIGIQDRYGNALTLTRDSNFNLTQITSSHGRWIHLTYDGANRVIQANDNIGRVVSYSYDSGGRLTRVVDANGGVWNYSYDAFNQMLSIQDPRGIFYLTNRYDANGRVIKQTQADNSVFTFSYTAEPTTGKITQTDYKDARGFVRRTSYSANNYKTSETFALGQPEQQTITYNRDPNTNLLTSVTDALSRQTSFSYDSLGNMTSITRLAGTANVVTTSLTYEPIFSQVTSITDPLGHATTFSSDGLSITDPLGHQTTLIYNSQGLPVSITDALGNTVQLSYSGGNLVGVTDPLGNTMARFVDSAGRVAAVTDALGRTTRFSYNPLDQVTSVTDPLQGVTSFTYDVNGNLLSLTDALNHTTSWTYDNLDRVSTRTDPLQRQETFRYDQGGNLVSATDRKGQVTTFQYDGLNRRTFVGFGTQGSGSSATYASTISYTYDAGNRMRQAVDSIAGTITRGYDDLNRLTSESTAQGSISYTYDNASRRATMTVPCASGAPACAPANYTWDNANRLTQITKAASTVSFGYDDADRCTSLMLPNGVSVLYTYDNNSELTGITYQLGASTLGNLSYAYDALGRRTQVSGSFARTSLPQLVVTASYDAANELTNWKGLSLSYDANGNMLSDGFNLFTWNARNQVATLNSVGLQYDALGRRVQNAAGTSFLYDGGSAVQELSGSTVTANLLNGGLDEVFSRTDSSGAFTQLKDGLGNTIALVDTNGNLQTAYSYDPFGATVASGQSNANEFEYTGRENEGNGLYYYRARYYSPLLGRFISQDPLGFAGSGPNLYAYAYDDPVNFIDPFGLQTTTASPPRTSPYRGTPSPSQVDQGLQSVEAATEAAEEGEATGAELGLGPLVGGLPMIFIPMKGPAACDDAPLDCSAGQRPSWAPPEPKTSPMAGRKSGKDPQGSGKQAKCFYHGQLADPELDRRYKVCFYICEDGEPFTTVQPLGTPCDSVEYKDWGQ